MPSYKSKSGDGSYAAQFLAKKRAERAALNPQQFDTCAECGYNAPHHDTSCSLAPKTTAYCPEHAPSSGALGSDDAKLTCSVCGVNGYHVKRFAQ